MILNINKNSEEEFFEENKVGKTWIPPQYPKKRPNAICCPNCGKDTGLENPFFMVIPPGGLVCSCGTTVIHSSSLMFY